MKNTYINIAFGILIVFAVFNVAPNISEAYSYTYNPNYTEPINITNNNYNNNINTNTGSGAGYRVRQNHSIYTYSTACTSCAHTNYRMAHYNSRCGAAIAVTEVTIPKPICTLVPAITSTGVIELQWTTYGATVAFIDAGIGHVNLVSGSRIINPQKDTAYNMTVINDAGIAGTCGAKVNVTVSDPVDPVDPIDPTDPGDDDGSLFGDTFRAIALPIGVAFLILIILLIVIMSKVKNSQ